MSSEKSRVRIKTNVDIQMIWDTTENNSRAIVGGVKSILSNVDVVEAITPIKDLPDELFFKLANQARDKLEKDKIKKICLKVFADFGLKDVSKIPSQRLYSFSDAKSFLNTDEATKNNPDLDKIIEKLSSFEDMLNNGKSQQVEPSNTY